MSQDFCKVFFSSTDAGMTLTKIASKVENIIRKHDVSLVRASCIENDIPPRDKCLEIEANGLLETDALREIFNFVNSLPASVEAFAEYNVDQSGETIYYSLADRDLAMFSCSEHLQDYLTKNAAASPEETFFSRFEHMKSSMLLRLMIKGKKYKSGLEQVCEGYINEPSEEMFAAVKLYVDTSKKPKGIDLTVDFPNLILDYRNFTGRCDIDVAKSMCYCESHGDYIYLGFDSNKLSSSAKEVLDGKTDVMNLMDAFSLATQVKDCRAKIWKKASPKKEWYVYAPEASLMTFSMDKSPVDLWRNPW